MEDIEVLKRVVERSDELNKTYGKDNWRVRTVTTSNNRTFLAITKELEHLGVQGGDKVIVATTTIDGKPVVIIEKL